MKKNHSLWRIIQRVTEVFIQVTRPRFMGGAEVGPWLLKAKNILSSYSFLLVQYGTFYFMFRFGAMSSIQQQHRIGYANVCYSKFGSLILFFSVNGLNWFYNLE